MIVEGLLVPFCKEYYLELILASVIGFFVYNIKRNYNIIRSEDNRVPDQDEVLLNSRLAGGKGSDEEMSSYPDNYETVSLAEDVPQVPFKAARFPEADMIKRSAEFYENMDLRRSVRAFSTETFPAEIIQNIIMTAGTSPSGAHTEPWTFIVVKDADIKLKLREIVEEEEEINYNQRMGKQWVADLAPFKTTWTKHYLSDAPYIILVFKQLYSVADDGTRKNHYYCDISVSIATGLLLAAIQNAGLSALVSTPLQCGGRIRVLFNRPQQEKLVLLIPVGYPAQDCTVPDLHRKPYSSLCPEFF